MRQAMAAMVLLAGVAWSVPGAAQDGPDFIDVTRTYRVGVGSLVTVREVMCPPGYVPLYLLAPNPDPESLQISQMRIDDQGRPDTFDTANVGGGFRVTYQVVDLAFFGTLTVRCVKASAYPIGRVAKEVVVAPGQTGIVDGSCPTPQVALGFATNVDGVDLQERFRVYLFGTPPNLTPLNGLQDGSYPVPTSTGLGVLNTTLAPRTLQTWTLCATLPGGALTIVQSTPVVAGERHALFAPVPDGFDLVGNSFTVSGSAQNNLTFWSADRRVSYEDFEFPTQLQNKGVWLEGFGTPPPPAKQQVVGRAVVGSLVVPSVAPVPPPTIVPIVEFYNATLDHYFITASAKEIADLDGGVHPGWQRTGETFNAYGAGSSGRTGRRPVCRAYGNPAAGLDSHFYSASPQECRATLENFGDDWLLEAAEVFEMELPDTTTGACPADRVPIYRLWNGRADSSHRFVKTLALRAQMIARRFVSEGYGENGVVFCALS